MENRAKKATKTIRDKFGDDYFSRIGQRGGKRGWRNKGFACELISNDGLDGFQRARIAGSKGGKKSRRGKAKIKSSSALNCGGGGT